MMNDRKDFVLAVIVALTVPVIFGGLYFYQMTREKGSNGYIAKLESDREFLMFGDNFIDKVERTVLLDSNYIQGNFVEFNVLYASGFSDATTYTLRISNVSGVREDELDGISWRLVVLDDDTQEYRPLSVGNFAESNNIIKLTQPTEISLGEEHHYRLYYYLNREIDNTGLHARVVVE